jgi:hypothetical protein
MRFRGLVLTFTLMAFVLAGALAAAGGTGYPDSKTQPLADGCTRSSLALLAEGARDTQSPDSPPVAPSWVYVNGDNTPRTVEGSVLAVHTAGTDLFGVHDTYDLNVDVSPTAPPAYTPILSTRNAAESPPQIHTEWESGLAPLWAWPEPGDRVRETGSAIWDCGHWQDGTRQFPGSDNIPYDPLGSTGVEPIGGEEIEIHPILELATWRAHPQFPVPSGQLDVEISNQGGKAKAVMECALVAPSAPAAGVERVAAGAGCSRLQDVTGRSYTYFLAAPPRPAGNARLAWSQELHTSHHAPAPVVTARADGILVTVPFDTVAASGELQDFGASFRVWWDKDKRALRHFRVTLDSLSVFNNLDGDIGEDQSDPSITPAGEWDVYVDVGGQWTRLRDHVAGLDAVPAASPAAPARFDLSGVPTFDVYLPADGEFRAMVDARECDLPGYSDCPGGPTNTELDFNQFPGRATITDPVADLTGQTTMLSTSPHTCPSHCEEGENASQASQCGGPCYRLDMTVEDVTAAVRGHQFRAITRATPASPAQEEEHEVLKEAVLRAQGACPPICS